ncbi:MAG: serpin family protein [Oscillospiraceae bacterium]|nr:serpin family protein [Oscillospiraceae bacterium]
MNTKRTFAMIAALALLLSLFGCTGSDVIPADPLAGRADVVNLMETISNDISDGALDIDVLDDAFIENSANFALDLFRLSLSESNENTLISPLSVLLALAMTTNGAQGDTLDQMEQVLGNGMPISHLNLHLRILDERLTNDDLHIANSIWFAAGRIDVLDNFLHTNAHYFNAAAYQLPFNPAAADVINAWVYAKTHGMIDSIVDEISANTIMYLINAIAFEADWEDAFDAVFSGQFNAHGGTVQNIDMMRSTESTFISNHRATGFIKPYAGGQFSFAAMLPNGDIDDFVDSLTGQEFMALMNSARQTDVFVQMPRFTFEYEINMNESLQALGMNDAFNAGSADFSGIGTSPIGNIYIGNVLHKTFIEVDEAGTRAAAATAVEIQEESMPVGEYVTLDRPFVFAIIDNATHLPIFIGTVMQVD